MPKSDLSFVSFRTLAQRSEQSRVRLMLGVLFTLVILGVIRRYSGDVAPYPAAFWWTQGLLAAWIVFELFMLHVLTRAISAGRVIRDQRWRLNAAVEIAFAVGMLVIGHLLSPQGMVAALSAPAILVLPLLVLLSVLRLRPVCTLWTGLVGAAAHAMLASRTYLIAGDDPFVLPVFLSYSIVLGIIAVAGFLVAKQVRGYVEEAVREARSLARVQEEIGRVNRDMSIAKEIQRGLLPQAAPAIPGFDVAGMSRAADQTGGDYYDWQELPDGRFAIVLADVSGHGIGPALVMAVCRAYARASLPLMQDPGTLLERINMLLHDDVHGSRFVTLALMVLDGPRSRFDLASAGHGPSFLLRAATGEIQLFGGDGVPLGIVPDATYEEARSIDMAPGDALVLLTDGFFEWRRESDNQQFGIERLTKLLKEIGSLNAATILDRIDAAVLAFAEGTKQSDDVTGVVIKRL
ncbi:MAG: PP2C family protein-serine/threonine phosphatase [Pyrinomonadaceae bacterium]|nr:PP2C family protein-serine/threonine phosphatase [Phycisphaerales bacterium]